MKFCGLKRLVIEIRVNYFIEYLFHFRFSPTEWSIEDSYSLVGGNGATVKNKFSISNSIWFVIASALGQSNADVTPRSPAGRYDFF